MLPAAIDQPGIEALGYLSLAAPDQPFCARASRIAVRTAPRFQAGAALGIADHLSRPAMPGDGCREVEAVAVSDRMRADDGLGFYDAERDNGHDRYQVRL